MPSLAVKLTADTAEFQADMGKAGHIAEREMERMVSRAAAAGTIIGNALNSMASGFRRTAEEAARAGAEVAKFSERGGFSVRGAAELRGALEVEGESWQQFTRNIGNFSKALAEAQNEGSRAGQLFRALGVDINAGPEKAFDQFAKAIKSLDPETKAAAMRVAFGQGADSLIPFMEKLDEARERAKRLGIVMGDELVADAKRFEDAMTTAGAASRSLAITAITPASGALATIAENLIKARERGTYWRDVALEIAKVVTAGTAALAENAKGWTVWAGFIEAAANKAYAAAEKIRTAMPTKEGEFVSGTRMIGGWRPSGPPVPPDAQERAACAVSGGKWDAERGVCVRRPEPKPRAERDPFERDRLAQIQQDIRVSRADQRALQDYAEIVAQMQADAEEMRRLSFAWSDMDFTGMPLDTMREAIRLRLQGLDSMQAVLDASQRMAAGFTEDGKAITESTKKTTDGMVEFWRSAAEQMQHSMSSFFFDLMQGNLKSLGSNFKRTVDKMVADMLAAKAATALFGADFGKSGEIGGLVGKGLGWLSGQFGGGTTGVGAAGFGEAAAMVAAPGGGFVPALASGTPFVKRAGLAHIDYGERVLTREQNRAYGGGMTVNVNVTGPVDRSSASQIAVATGRAVQRAIERNT